MEGWKCLLAGVVALLLACAGGTEGVRQESAGDADWGEGSVYVTVDTEEGEGGPAGAFLPEGWEHLVLGAVEDPLDGAVAVRPPVRRGGGARAVRQPPLLATPRPTPLQAQLRAQWTANQAVVMQARQTYDHVPAAMGVRSATARTTGTDGHPRAGLLEISHPPTHRHQPLNMRETFEFRIEEERAQQFLEPGLGVLLGDSVRKVLLPGDDPRVQQIGEIQRARRKKGDLFFTSWNIHRKYTEEELQSAEVLNLVIRAYFEPTGTEVGTEYDEEAACKHCGAGAPLKTELILNTKRLPKSKDIAQSIGGEVVVSSRLVKSFKEHGLRGAEFRPVLHNTRKGPQPSEWFHPVFTSKPVKLDAKTVTGNNPFDLDERNEFRCPKGHMAGLNQLSELYLKRASYDGSDFSVTDKYFGDRRGELRPERRLLISPRFREVLEELGAKGFKLEVAHFV
jgi:hypothetical protein